ncbi:MAG TPA: MarR family winged helix-turn-helix transcriptional regulator [Pirellulales bacterium]|nr:MarR family winged helix-turn-helix transcriptional regulator [Pirellulales bacterium]
MARTCACFNFRKASRSVTQLFDQTLAPTGLRSTQLVILITGELMGPSSIAGLARELVMDRSTLTRNLKPLLNLGLLELSKSDNAKQKLVEVTAAGRSALAQAIPFWEVAQGHLVTRLGEGHWSSLLGELSGIVQAARPGASHP